MIQLSRLVSRSDWLEPSLQPLIDEAFGLSRLRHPSTDVQDIPLDSKLWENALAVRTLDFLSGPGQVLGVGAGIEVTTYMLQRRGHLVFPSDIYMDDGAWKSPELLAFFINPRLVFPERSRRGIIPIHADALDLPFPSESMDGVFSSGSLEHFGTWDDIIQGFREMCRVVKPGGLLSLSTEFRIDGPASHITWDPSVYLFTQDSLAELVRSAPEMEWTGPDPLFDVQKVVDDEEPRLLLPFLHGEQTYIEGGDSIYPNLLMSHEGFLFCSVHLALRKVEASPENHMSTYSSQVLKSDQLRLAALDSIQEDQSKSDLTSQATTSRTATRLRWKLHQDLIEIVQVSDVYSKSARRWTSRKAASILRALGSALLHAIDAKNRR